MNQKIYGLRYDPSFKKVFGNKEHLKQLMEDLFYEEISNFFYCDKEITKGNKNLRYGMSDVVIETEDKIIIIEIQNKDLENLKSRLKIYVSGFYIRQNIGKNYEAIKPVEVYLILNYKEGKKAVLKEYEILEKNLKEQFDQLSNIKIWNIREAIKKEGTIDYDYAKLFLLDKYKEATDILKEMKKKKKFQKLVKEIELYNMDIEMYKKLKEAEEMEMSFEQATSAIRSHAEKRGEIRGEKRGVKIGEKKGRILGEKRGIKIGEKKGKLEMANQLLAVGVSIEAIMKATELTKEQIEEYGKTRMLV